MIWIYPEQLLKILTSKFKSVYILFGNDLCLLQDSQFDILNIANTLNYLDNFNINIDIHYDWNRIFDLFKTANLFSTQKILSLKFPQDYPLAYFNKYMLSLASAIYKGLVLILIIHTSCQIIQHKTWMQFFNNKNSIFVNCFTPDQKRLAIWIKNVSKRMDLIMEDLSCQLLCYYYEGNLLSLKQILQHLSLIYPDGNLSFIRIKKIITDESFFNSNHWIEAVLTGNKQRANRILKRLEYTDINFKILLSKIQHEILIVTQIKHRITNKEPLYNLLRQYKIRTNYHRIILSQSIQRFTFNQLHQAMSLLIQMELRYHQNYMYLSILNFKLLTEILCCNNKNSVIYNMIKNYGI